ncbi:MAG: hypothetical protein AAF514_16385, partial [Verrucomicrobiota bacterium]
DFQSMRLFTALWVVLALLSASLAAFFYSETVSWKAVHLKVASDRDQLAAELEQAQSEIADLKTASGSQDRRRRPARTSRPRLLQPVAGPSESPEETAPHLDLALAAALVPAFEKRMERWQSKWVTTQLKSLGQKLNLTDLQKDALQKKLEAVAARQSLDLKTALSEENQRLKKRMPKIKFSDKEEDQLLSGVLEETLSKEQFLAYRSERLTRQAKAVEKQANSDLRRLSRSLELNTEQGDRVFEILVKASSAYDTAMRVEGSAPENDEQREALSPDEAIRELLNEEQLALYETARLSKKNKREKNKKGKKS